MKNITKIKGFTLVELLIAMAIFVMFTGIVIRSYADIVYSQRGANEYRMLYSNSREIMDALVDDIRDNFIYYLSNISSDYSLGSSELVLISKDADFVKKYYIEDFQVMLSENFNCGNRKNSFVLSDEKLIVKELSFYVSPAFDPYLEQNAIYDSLQFHPKVSVYLKVSNGKSDIDFQTTVSSRNYSSSPNIDITCLQ